MNLPWPNPRELEQWFQDLEDGCLSPENHHRLMDLMRADPLVRARYRDHMILASALRPLAVNWASERVPAPVETPEIRARRIMRRSFLAAAAAVAIGAAVFALIAPKRLPPVAVTSGPDTTWSFTAGGVDESGDFTAGSRIQIQRGSLHIATRKGSELVLEGPAEFEWKSPMEGALHSGSGWFRIVEEEIGFTVLSPRLKTVDLGTAFGVSVTVEEEQVHVAEGRVRVASRFARVGGRVLTAGQAVTADSVGRTTPIPYQDERFLKELPEKIDGFHWSFDDPSGGFAGGKGGHLRLDVLNEDGPVEPVLVDGPFGKAYDAGRTGGGAQAGFPGIPGATPRSISIWVKGRPTDISRTDPYGKFAAVNLVGWGEDLQTGGKWQLSIGDGRSIVTLWGGAWIGAMLPDDGNLLDGEWHHVVSVFTGKYHNPGHPEIHHYVDGRYIPNSSWSERRPVNTREGGGESKPLSLLLNAWSTEPLSVNPWAVDELRIYRHPLDETQVRRLFSENRIDDP